MTEKLIELGHTMIGFVTGRSGTATTTRRLEGFLAAMKDANLPVPDDLTAEENLEYRSGLDADEVLLSRAKRPTAIFASNDGIAAGLIAAAHKFGLSVPADLSIAGFDDSVLATVVWSPLTTAHQPIKEMAATAVSSVIAKLRG
jgi:LacI family transcriptional regulator